MSKLYTYTIPIDDGAATNPFNGLCALAICKPRIRSVAKIGDWIAGLGSKNSPSGNLSGKLVYAMKVDEVLSMEQYDIRCKNIWKFRIPKTDSLNLQDRLGDCIYDYSSGSPSLRHSVHGENNIDTDLSGKNVLIAKEFYYFGSKAIDLPQTLLGIVHQTQGHKSDQNDPFVQPFVNWIQGSEFTSEIMHGWPDTIINWSEGVACNGCIARKEAAEADCQRILIDY